MPSPLSSHRSSSSLPTHSKRCQKQFIHLSIYSPAHEDSALGHYINNNNRHNHTGGLYASVTLPKWRRSAVLSSRIYGTLLVGWKDLRFDNDAIKKLFVRVYVFSCFSFLICVPILRGSVLWTDVWGKFSDRVVVQRCEILFCSAIGIH